MGVEASITKEPKEGLRTGPVIYLARHGKTKYAEDGSDHLVSIDSDDPLSELGESQSREMGERIASEVEPGEEVVVIASPYERAQMTAGIVVDTLQKRGVKVRKRNWLAQWAERFDKFVWNTERRRNASPHFRMGKKRSVEARASIREEYSLGKTRLFTWAHVLPFIYGDAQPLSYSDSKGRVHTAQIDVSKTNPGKLNHKQFFARNGLGKLLKSGELERILTQVGWSEGTRKEFMDTVKMYETFAETTMRMIKYLSRLRTEYAGKKVRIVVITHRALLNFMTEYFSDGDEHSVEPGDYIKLEARGSMDGESLIVTEISGKPAKRQEDLFQASRNTKAKLERGDAPV